jgi:hypothetical protein
LRQLCLDGRYATHHAFGRAKAIDRDLSQLSFWIDECSTNCCRSIDGAFPALAQLFGRGPATDASDLWPDPLVLRLRRHLLPRRERLRWSHLANGYVVAGVSGISRPRGHVRLAGAGPTSARSGMFVPWASTTPIPACAPSSSNGSAPCRTPSASP